MTKRSSPSVLSCVGYWWAFCMCCAAILAWTYRHSADQDGLSYLDIAFEASKHGLKELVNGYWSPAYPAVMALAFLVLRPTAAQEWPLFHLVNLCIFVFGLFTFSFFYHYWSEMTYARDGVDDKNKGGYITPFAFCTFL